MLNPLTRRTFLLSSLSVLAALEPFQAAGAKKRRQSAGKTGLRSLSREDWPPAIVPDHIGITDKSLVSVSDEFGRLALVDFKGADGPRVAGELSGFGKRVLDLIVSGQRAYALTLQDSASGEPEFTLSSLSLAPASEPSVMSRVTLDQYSEPICVAASQDLIVVGGTATNGNNLVTIYRRGRSAQPGLIASFTVEQQIVRMDLQDRHLVILSGLRNTQVDYVNLFYPQAPQIRKSFKLNGDFPAMARLRQNLFVAGQSTGSQQFEVKAISLEPAPHAVNSNLMGNVSAVLDAAVQKNRVLIVCERGADRLVTTYTFDKTLDLTPEQTLVLPGGKTTDSQSLRISVRERSGYIAAGWMGVEVLSQDKLGWKHTFTYSIPRMPASGVASWGDTVVLAGADLKVYNVAKPDKPTLVLTAEPGSTVKSIAGAGSFVLCLAQNALSLRKMTNPNEIAGTINIAGGHMAFDAKRQKAYVISASDKRTVVTPIKVYSNSLVAEKPFEITGSYRRVAADDGRLVVRGLNDVAVYEVSATAQPVGKRHFDTLAIRDVWIGPEYLLATAVDHNSKGFLLVLDRHGELKSIGVVDLPSDGVAITASGEKAVVIGRSPEGKDLLSVVSLSSSATPQVVASFPVVEAASAVAIKDNLAIVVGRGLEILSLS